MRVSTTFVNNLKMCRNQSKYINTYVIFNMIFIFCFCACQHFYISMTVRLHQYIILY